MAAHANHTIDFRFASVDGRLRAVSVWMFAASYDVGRVVSFPTLTMPYYRFHAERIVEADSSDEARAEFEGNSRDFAASAECDELPDDYWMRSRDPRERVLVTVRGGVAEAFYDDSKVMLEIVDEDDLEAEGADVDRHLEELVRIWGFPDSRAAGSVPAVPIRGCYESRGRADPHYELYKLVTEDAQLIAEKELGRSLTEEELEVVERKIGDYLDWSEAMTFCLRERIAGEM